MLRVFDHDLADGERFVVTLEPVPGTESRGRHVEMILSIAGHAYEAGCISAVSITDNPGGIYRSFAMVDAPTEERILFRTLERARSVFSRRNSCRDHQSSTNEIALFCNAVSCRLPVPENMPDGAS